MLLAFYVSHHVYKKPQRWWFQPFCCCRGFLFSFNIFEIDYLKAFFGKTPFASFPFDSEKKTLRNSIHKSTTNRKNNLVKFYPHRSLIRFQTSVFLWWWCWILIWTIMILLFYAIFLKDIGLEEAVFVIISYDRLFFMYNNILYWLNLYNLWIGVPNRQKFNKYFPVRMAFKF